MPPFSALCSLQNPGSLTRLFLSPSLQPSLYAHLKKLRVRVSSLLHLLLLLSPSLQSGELTLPCPCHTPLCPPVPNPQFFLPSLSVTLVRP